MIGKFNFSVILPVYKKVDFIDFSNSLNSILFQKLQADEIIVIYDGPVNLKIKNYVKKMMKKFKILKTINFSRNRGLGTILRYGIRKAKFPYIARCDADDISLPHRFYEQVNHLKKNSKIDVLSSNVLEKFENIKTTKKKIPQYHFQIKKKIFFRNPINHNSVIFRKEKILKSGNYKSMPFFEDYYLWFRVLKNGGKFYNLQKYHVTMKIDKSYYARRSGLKYYRYYLNFLNRLSKQNMIPYYIYLFNLILRFNIIFIPKKILIKFYNYFLRN